MSVAVRHRAPGWMLLLGLLVAAVMLLPGEASAFQPLHPYGERTRLIVRFAPAAEFNVAARGIAHLRAGTVRIRGLRGMAGYDLVDPPQGSSLEEVLRRYRNDPTVLYAEPDYPVTIAAAPDDPLFANQWALENTGQSGGAPGADIKATDAWGSTTGGPEVLVAVVDTGVDYQHPDLASNMWDGLGWDFAEKDADPMDVHGHGTHVAGSIAAVGDDGFGVAGVSWDARIMALKALANDGSGWTSDIVEAVAYASTEGADIINLSLEGAAYSQAFYDAIAGSDALVVCAAGNSGADSDVTPSYPASYDLDNIVSVAATDHNDALAAFSNHGATSVDLGAPGVSILSTLPGVTYSVSNVLDDPMDSLLAWDTSIYQYNPWTLSATPYVSSPHSAGHAPGGGYVANEESWLITRDYMALEEADRVRVRLSARLDTLSTDDWLVVAARPEGGEWVGVGYVAGSTGGAFGDFEAELPGLAGTRGQLAIGFWSGNVGGGAGVWVDDVEVDALVRDPAGDYVDAHGYKSGTSMAAPHVAGVAALLKAYVPNLDAAALKAAILGSVEPVGTLSGKTVTGGRLDAATALAAVKPNSVPVARDVAFVSEAGVELVAPAPGVLVNDTDADEDTLSAELLADAAVGEVQLEPDGGFTYTPAAGFLGTEVFTYRAFDGVDYSEPARVSLTVTDTVDPISTAAFSPSVPGGLAGWYITAPVVTIEATDGGSGIDHVEWRLEGGGWTPGAVILDIPDGTNTIEHRAVDVAGNVEQTRSAAVKVDSVAPLTKSDARDEYTGAATITLGAADNASGVANTYFRIGDASVAEYDAPIVIDEPGGYALTFWSTDVAGNVELEQTVPIRVSPPTQSAAIMHDDGGVTFGRWVKGYSAAYSGGGYVYSRWAGEWLEVRFVGSEIIWYGPKQPNYGMADVYLNGAKVETVDQYASDAERTLDAVVFEASGLDESRMNTLRIKLEGAANPASTGTTVVVDRFEIEGISVSPAASRLDERDDRALLSGAWVSSVNSAYVNRGYVYSRRAGSVFRATFTGTRVAWIGPRTGSYGRAAVYIDGVRQGSVVSQYGPTAWRYRVWESGVLSPGIHVIEISPTGTKDPASAATNIVIDAIDVTP